MFSVALCGDNLVEIMPVNLHFKQQNRNHYLIVNLKRFPWAVISREASWLEQATA